MKRKAMWIVAGLFAAGLAQAGDWRGGVWVYQPNDGYRQPIQQYRYDPRSPYSHYPQYRQYRPDNRVYVPPQFRDGVPQRIRPGDWSQSRRDRFDNRFDRRHDRFDRRPGWGGGYRHDQRYYGGNGYRSPYSHGDRFRR